MMDSSQGEKVDSMSPEEAYEDYVINYMNERVDSMLESGQDPTIESYLAFAHKITTGLLERGGVKRNEDGSFDISASRTYETGEFELLPNLLQKVPGITIEIIKVDDLAKPLELDTAKLRRAELTNRMLNFGTQFEEKILPIIKEEKGEQQWVK